MPSITISEVEGASFDFIVVGGGTSGLALAVRLAENPKFSVLVLEAGKELDVNDPLVQIPGLSIFQFKNPKYDWNYLTVPQANANNRSLTWNRSKMLGGSSAMNLQRWIYPPAHDFDVFEKLGNSGWNWEAFKKHARNVEKFTPATKERMEAYPHTHRPEVHGTNGPIDVTVTEHPAPLDILFEKTVVDMGLPRIDDAYDGDINGIFMTHANVNPNGWTRVTSATGYYYPMKDKLPNLHVLPEATVTKLVFDDAKNQGDNLHASAVQFLYENRPHTVTCNKEIILSSGSIANPQLLELSGIGNPEILKSAGVIAKIDLPGVGENVQEHLMSGTCYEITPGEWGPHTRVLMNEEYRNSLIASYSSGGKPIQAPLLSLFLYAPVTFPDKVEGERIALQAENEVAAMKSKGCVSASLAEQYEIQLAALRDPGVPDCELVLGTGPPKVPYAPTAAFMGLHPLLNHPLSRGTIHIKSSEPLEQPEINPNIFQFETDMEILVHQIKLARKMAESEPLKSIVLKEVHPGPDVKTDADIREYIKNTAETTWHTAGSCSMLPRDKQGVVGPDLLVHGTSNLRVVDISVIPLHIAAHTQASSYVVAEKGAEIICEKWGRI